MRKITVAVLAGLLMFTLVSAVLAEEEDDIRGRREKWLEKVILGGLVEKAQAAPALQADPDHNPLDDIVGPGGESPYPISNLEDVTGKERPYLQDVTGKETPVYDGKFVRNKVEAAIRENGFFIPTPERSYEANFDLDGNKAINATDQILVRNLCDLPEEQAKAILTKILAAVEARYGSANPKDKNLDINGDGKIDQNDYELIATLLLQVDGEYTCLGERANPPNNDLAERMIWWKHGSITQPEFLQKKEVEQKSGAVLQADAKYTFIGEMADQPKNDLADPNSE